MPPDGTKAESSPVQEMTYSVGAAARITGLSPELLRAWERRYHAVEPLRTEGGTRLYRGSDLERLRLIKGAVEAGHRVSRVARLDEEALRALAEPGAGAQSAAPTLEPILAALAKLDGPEVQRLLAIQLSVHGPSRFARDLAAPLAVEIGDRWSDGRLDVASEHLATGVLRTLLGTVLQPGASTLGGPRVVFATPSGERHELGLQIAALTVLGAGALPIYLGVELPVEDLLSAVESAGASALALSLVAVVPAPTERTLAALRTGLPSDVELWVGGAAVRDLALPDGVVDLADLDALEQRAALLRIAHERRT
jgi:DNA-binding transcriptional MerR regulator